MLHCVAPWCNVSLRASGGAQEHEGIDRPNNSLAGLQSQFAEAVLALDKPTLLVMANGGTLAIEQLVGRCGVLQRDAP